MKDYSIFQGWKELHGNHGVFSFEDKGPIWNVFQHKTDEFGMKGRFYIGSIDKVGIKTNVALYTTAVALLEEE